MDSNPYITPAESINIAPANKPSDHRQIKNVHVQVGRKSSGTGDTYHLFLSELMLRQMYKSASFFVEIHDPARAWVGRWFEPRSPRSETIFM